MFVFTTKLTKKKLAGMIVAAGGLLVLIIALVASRSPTRAGKELGPVKNINSDTDRVAYLERMGWEVSKTPVGIEEVLIPLDWNDAFEDYNNLQNDQGFELANYRGKRVTRISFSVKNHPSGMDNVQANLLCYKNSIIAGDVQCISKEGFMHGLSRQAAIGLFSAPKPSKAPELPPAPDNPQVPPGSGHCPECELNGCNCDIDPTDCTCANCTH